MGANQTYIEKADLSIANLTSGGLLVAQQAKEFMELLIEESALLSMVTTVPLSAPSYEVSKMGFTSRVLRAASEGQALPESDRSKPELDKVTLSSNEFIAEARIPYGVVEDNIANGNFQAYAMQLLAKAVSRDMEDGVINGDVSSTDAFLAVQDGLLAQATTNVISGGGVRLTKGVLKKMVQTLPSRYLKAQKNLCFMTSKNACIDYSDSLSNRMTVLGDSKVTGQGVLTRENYMGYDVVPIPLFPEDQGSGDKTTVVLADPKNIHVGLHRDIRVETARDISAREFIIVATVRFGVKWAHEPASVFTTGILASAGA